MKNQKNKHTVPKKLFLIDSIGALTSAFFLGVILVRFESAFGMPTSVLYKLALMACIFALYSATCYFKMPDNWPLFLKAIAIINLSYSCLTIALVVHFYEKLTLLGVVYFVGELSIVIALAVYELKTALRK